MNYIDKLFTKLQNPIVNRFKLHILKHHSDLLLSEYYQKIEVCVRQYCRVLPPHISHSEFDDLLNIAKLEFLETLKVWDLDKSNAVWPLAKLRVVGAMRDHIRYITKSNPTGFYEWVADAAYMVQLSTQSARFEKQIEDGIDLNNLMEVLDYRERKIVLDHTKEDMTFKEIGSSLGVSESQVSRIFKKSLDKMRKVLRKAGE